MQSLRTVLEVTSQQKHRKVQTVHVLVLSRKPVTIRHLEEQAPEDSSDLAAANLKKKTLTSHEEMNAVALLYSLVQARRQHKATRFY